MNQCQRCGANNEPTSRFCVACGAPLARSQPAPAEVAQRQSNTAPPPAPPPSSNLAFAETAAPPTREEFEAQRAAVQAAAAALRAQVPPPQYPPGTPMVAYTPGVQPATAAMPGVAQDPEAVPEGAPRMLAGFIVSYDPNPLGRFWPIYQGRSRVGRERSGPDTDIELDHPTASARHALIYAAACPGRLKIEDSGSTNGTLLNGARLSPGIRYDLKDGDRVRFGLLSTIIKIV